MYPKIEKRAIQLSFMTEKKGGYTIHVRKVIYDRKNKKKMGHRITSPPASPINSQNNLNS